jgi:hypothetical protein
MVSLFASSVDLESRATRPPHPNPRSFGEDCWSNVYAGELEVRPPGLRLGCKSLQLRQSCVGPRTCVFDISGAFGYVYHVDTDARRDRTIRTGGPTDADPSRRGDYGRAVLNGVQRRLNRDVSAGAVCATLERLEGKELVSSRLAPGTALRGGRARRYFVPTSAGLRALTDARFAIESLRAGFARPLKVRA